MPSSMPPSMASRASTVTNSDRPSSRLRPPGRSENVSTSNVGLPGSPSNSQVCTSRPGAVTSWNEPWKAHSPLVPLIT